MNKQQQNKRLVSEYEWEKDQINSYLKKNLEVIFIDEKRATRINLVQCKLQMKTLKPIRTRVCPLNLKKQKALQKEVDELLAAGMVQLLKSIYASAPILVKKKDGTWRLAIDYRRVNEELEDFSYPLPLIQELFNAFYRTKYYSSINLA